MAVTIQTRLEHEADDKGLAGDKRKAWIGGAWNRIRGKEQRSSWRHSEEAKLLSRYFGPVHDVRQRERSEHGLKIAERHRDHVVLRQGRQWFDLPRAEYKRLISESAKEAKKEQRELAKAERQKRGEAREIARYERAVAQEQKQEEKFRVAQERDLHRMEREQYSDVVAVIKHSGGIRPSVSGQGKKYDRGEYDTLPSTVKSSTGRLTLDDAARNVNAAMPHLGIDTIRDLVDYFDRHRTRGYTLHKAS